MMFLLNFHEFYRKWLFTISIILVFTSGSFAQTTFKIMPLGDSITRGFFGSTDGAGYRNDLSDSLNAEGVLFNFVGSITNDPAGAGFDSDHEGHDGFRADQILANINLYLGANPDIVLLHIGTNNNLMVADSIAKTRDEISQIIDAIDTHDPTTLIILASLIPRTDAEDAGTTSLNNLLVDLYQSKQAAGKKVFYAPMNEIFKSNPNWATDYYATSDHVHPKDAGYALMAGVWINSIMTAINIGSDITVTDNFTRNRLGETWVTDPNIIIQGNNLVDNSPSTVSPSTWKEMAVYKGLLNPSSVSLRWAASADAAGINEGGLALLLDSASETANGYLAWITTGDNILHLWTIANGESAIDLNQDTPSFTTVPGPGDVFRVDVTVDPSNLQFNYYVNDVFAGNITIANPGVTGQLYSGVLLRHNRNNQVNEFTVKRAADVTPPDAITNLQSTGGTATSVTLSWTAPGDDGSVGQASSYDVRYSTGTINSDGSNFDTAMQATGEPNPSAAGAIESFTVSGLAAGTTYNFAVKTSDEAGNTSTISNVITASTVAGNLFVDDFNRSILGSNWTADADYAIVNNQLANTSTGASGWNEIAVLNIRKKPVEISYTYAPAPDADAGGIDQSGFVIVTGAASELSSGYAITRRTGANNEIRLWTLTNGQVVSVIEKEIAPNLSPPVPGDEVKIVISTDATGNHFDYFINGVADGRVSDAAKTVDLSMDYWGGVTLNGGLNNNIDNFTELLEVGPPANFDITAGDAQVDTVGQTLPIPLTVRVTDGGGAPIEGANVGFTVLTGGGSVDVPPQTGEIVLETELASLNPPMQLGNDPQASNGQFISVPTGNGGAQSGTAIITFNVDQAGDYIVWGRAIHPSAVSDAFWVSVDGGVEGNWDIGQGQTSSTWDWDVVSSRGTGTRTNPELDPVVFTLSTGQHTIKFREGKEGAELDQIVITQVGSGFTPPGDQSAVDAGGTLTDAAGEAKANFTLGTVSGTQTVQANFSGFAPLTFNITATADAPVTITKLSGDNQTAPRGTQLSLPFTVEIKDQYNNLYANMPTIWTVIRGDGTLDNSAPNTDVNGQAQVTMTISPDSAFNIVKVSAPGYTGADVTFTALAEAGNAAAMSVAGGNNQTGSAGHPLANTIDVMVTDDIGTPVPNHSVAFTVTNGGGKINGGAQATVQTNGLGIASATWTLGPTAAAANEVQAVATFNNNPLTGSPLTFTAVSADPNELDAVSSLSQNGIAGVPLTDSITVRVLDALNQPLGQYPVTFTVTLGSGKVNGSVNPIEVTTNDSGFAKVSWQLGPMAGTSNNKLRATATFNSNNLTGSPLEFTASAQIGNAAIIQLVSGNNQTGQVLTTLAEPFVVRVTDVNNNPVSNWPVTFNVISGGGNFSGNSSVVINTGADGTASAPYTLGSEAGTLGNEFNNLVEAVAVNGTDPLSGSPVSFQASAVATAATTLELVSGNDQTGPAGQPLPDNIKVKVSDAQGNGISGHTVLFETSSGNGTIDGTTLTSKEVTTDGSGVASVSWYLGGDIQNTQNMVVSATDGINHLSGSPLTVQATALKGPVDPDSSMVISDRSILPADGTTKAAITIKLTDKFGNPVQGKAVLITSTGSNNDITQPLNTTNANGEAFGSISSTSAEVKTISARNVTDGFDLNSFVVVTFKSQAADRMQLNGGNNQIANVGTAVPTPISVKVLDVNNNGVEGVDVNFEVTGGGGYLISGNDIPQGALGKVQKKYSTDSQGIASAFWVLGSQPGANSVEASVTGLTGSPIQFSATGESAVATTMIEVAGNGQTGIRAGDSLPEKLKVKVVDSQGNPVAGIDVLFEVQQGGGVFKNNTSSISVATDPFGLAAARFTLGPTVGVNVVHAINASLAGSPLPFTFISVLGPPAILSINSGDGSSGPVQSIVPISIKTTDVNGNPVPGVSAAFQVIEGGGSVESFDNVTDSQGIATAQIRLPNTVGTLKVKATSDRLPGFFKIFTITVTSGSATNIVMMSENNVEGTVGRELVNPLVVKVVDIFGNPVEGRSIQWVVTNGGGNLEFLSTVTDSNGLSENHFTLGPDAGINEAWAIASGLSGSPAVFTATGVTNNFPVFVGLNDTIATEGTLLNIQLKATDADNDPISYSAPSIPPGAVFNSTTALFSWNPAEGQAGDHQVTFKATDNNGGFDEKTITISVRNSNHVPVITDFSPSELSFVFRHGESINFSVTATDGDNDQLTYEWRIFTENDNTGTLLSTSSSFELVANNFLTGTYRVRVEVSDGMDTATLEWESVDIVSSVELATFTAQFTGFDGVKIVWTTSREIDNTGFNVLRSLTPNGSFKKINDDLILTASNGKYQFTDKKIVAGERYFYKLEDVDINGVKTQHDAVSIDVAAPETFELSQNYPNPFNPETKIRFQLPSNDHVTIKIFDVLGREVRILLNEDRDAGYHIVTWDAKDNLGLPVSSGIYYYQIVSGEFKQTKKMLLMK